MHVEIIEPKILKQHFHSRGHKCLAGPLVKRLRQPCQPIASKNWYLVPRYDVRQRPHHRMPKSYNTPKPRGLLPGATRYEDETTHNTTLRLHNTTQKPPGATPSPPWQPEAAQCNPEVAHHNPEAAANTFGADHCNPKVTQERSQNW